MRPILAAFLAIATLSAPVVAEPRTGGDAVVRQMVVQLDERPDRLAERLAAAMPPGADPVAMGDGTYMLAFAGTRLPTPLVRFLARSFEGTDGEDLPLDRVRTVSLHLSPRASGTELRAVLVAPRTEAVRQAARDFHERIVGAPIAARVEIVFDGAGGGGTGDLVLSTPGERAAIADAYARWLEASGHRVTAQSLGRDTLIVGERGATAALVFVQPDPDRPGRSLVVIRSVEEE